MAADPPLPDYEPMLRAFHRGFAAELGAMVDALPIRPGDTVLEVACGDGAYTAMLARRVGPTGLVVALDLSTSYLRVARGEADAAPSATQLVAGAVERLPFGPGRFDLVWCAQSLFSLPEPRAAVARMAAMARPGGTVAVLEDDTLHQVILPWPADLELAVRAAEWGVLARRPHFRKFYIGRRLLDLFAEVGLVNVTVRTFATDRAAPLDPDTQTYLAEYLAQLRATVADHLDPPMRDRFEHLVDPASPAYLPNAPTLAVTVINRVVRGRVGT